MEDSAYQALYTGVYVFVFIIALSTTIYLFKTMTDYSDMAYEYGKDVTSDNILENVTDSDQRIISGSDVLVYIFNYIKKDKFEEASAVDQEYKFNFITSKSIKVTSDYYTLKDKIKYDGKYVITYDSESNGVPTLTIREL